MRDWNRQSEGKTGYLARDDRSMSEVMSYALVFGLVVTTIGIVLVSGFGSLEEVRDSERVSNAERAYDVLADNFASIYERNSPSRSTEVDLGESEIVFGTNSSMTVEVHDGADFERYQYNMRPIVFQVTDDASLVYEGGAVFRDERDGGIVRRGPPFLLTSERVHVPFVQTTSEGVRSVGGTTVLVRGESANRTVLVQDMDGNYDEVRVYVTSPRYELWERYFEEETALTGCTTNDAAQRVECSLSDPETVYLTRQQIDISVVL